MIFSLKNCKIIAIWCLIVLSPSVWAIKLTIDIENIRKAGNLMLVVFDNEEDFKMNPAKTKPEFVEFFQTAVQPGSHTVELDLMPGEYAFKMFIDRNENGKLDFKFWGPPKEQVGVSNNALRMGAPKYEDAKFTLSSDMVMPIKLTK